MFYFDLRGKVLWVLCADLIWLVRFCAAIIIPERHREGAELEETTMKTHYTIALSVVVGVAIGAAAIQTLHAQAKPPVYMVAINEISDQEGYTKQYLPTAQKTIKDHGGVYVAAGPGTQIDGSFPKGRVVILRWESSEALQGWRHSPEYENIRKVGEGFAKYNVVAVDGVRQ
jgi:uncharacterized protein (DUF1330 family)